MKRCYAKVEDRTRTVLVIEDGEPTPSITVHTYRDGREVEEPLRTVGRLEGNRFVYGDGTALTLAEDGLHGPDEGFLAHVFFPPADCP